MVPGFYVKIVQMKGRKAPQPLPLDNGFDKKTAYLVLDIQSYSETGEAYLCLVNGRGEVWFISNRHCRAAYAVVLLDAQPRELRRNLK